jgi:hypothetical protein
MTEGTRWAVRVSDEARHALLRAAPGYAPRPFVKRSVSAATSS